MNEILIKLYTQFRMAWRHRWVALVTMVVICFFGAVYVASLPDTYRVTAKLYVDTTSLLQPALRGLALDSRASLEAVDLMRRSLLLRPNLEKIMRATDMDLQVTNPEETEELLAGLKDNVSLSQTARTNIFNIAYESDDPNLAKRVVDSVLNLFLEQSLGDLRKDTALTQEFIERQIKEYEAKLELAEERLRTFKRQNIGFLPGAASDYVSKRESVSEALREAQLQLQEATNRRNELSRQLKDPGDASLWMPPIEEVQSPLDGRIQELEARLDQLLLRYTDRHPDVVITRRLIDDLQEQKRVALEAMTQGSPDEQDPNVENPVFQGLKVALSASDADVAAMKVRVGEYEAQMAELERLTDESLRVEAEFTRLNRDYGVLHQNYQSFLSRREQAEIGYEADQTGGNMMMRIIEPPRIPILPTGPQRELLSLAVLLVGLGAGIGLSWLLSMINPVFLDIGQLALATGRPDLGVVSISGLSAFTGPRMEIVTFVMAFVAVLGVFGAVIVFQPLPPGFAERLIAMVR
jgi:polysaccharide chain length determinant protein (PEP-CTERM system associated)